LESSVVSAIIVVLQNAEVAQLVERNLAKVEVESSRLFFRSSSLDMQKSSEMLGSNAGVAQLVERNLAKVEVESSRLFSRSRIQREARLPFFYSDTGVAQFLWRGSKEVMQRPAKPFRRVRFPSSPPEYDDAGSST
jgi:hypothetical protein